MASYKELLAQRDALNKQIADARKVELADAIKQVKAIIQEYELTAADCGFISEDSAVKLKKPVAVYYRTPNGDEWSGRGRTPVTIQELLNQGHTIEEFLTEEGKAWAATKKSKK